MELPPVSRFSFGTLIADRYEVQSLIGSGAMGVVIRVRDRRISGEASALKLLHRHVRLSEKSFSRFQNEVLIMRQLTHENIVRIYDMGETEEGESFISMEHVDGANLSSMLAAASDGVLDFSTAVDLLRQTAAGLQIAHDRGIVHRDLKPENILITTKGVVKLADFGIARMSGNTQGLTATGEMIGTPWYMSPEQIREEEVDIRADIYAFGILAFELAVGHRPFQGTTYYNLFNEHLNEPIPIDELRNKGVPRWYVEMTEKCCEKDRARRFSSASELLCIINQQTSSTQDTATSILNFRERRRQTVKRMLRGADRRPVLLSIVGGCLLTSGWFIARQSEMVQAIIARPLFALEKSTGIPLDPLYSVVGINYRPTSESLVQVVRDTSRTKGDTAIWAIISAGVNPDIPAKIGEWPPLHAAIQASIALSAAELLRRGANPNIEFKGDTALSFALAEGRWSFVGTLLQYGADPLLPDGKGTITLDNLTRDGGGLNGPDILEKLLKKAPNIQLNVVFSDGSTPLSRAVKFENEPLIQMLLDGPAAERADPLFPQADGKTPRQLAQNSNNPKLRRLLETLAVLPERP